MEGGREDVHGACAVAASAPTASVFTTEKPATLGGKSGGLFAELLELNTRSH
jgi:hypothetical protein